MATLNICCGSTSAKTVSVGIEKYPLTAIERQDILWGKWKHHDNGRWRSVTGRSNCPQWGTFWPCRGDNSPDMPDKHKHQIFSNTQVQMKQVFCFSSKILRQSKIVDRFLKKPFWHLLLAPAAELAHYYICVCLTLQLCIVHLPRQQNFIRKYKSNSSDAYALKGKRKSIKHCNYFETRHDSIRAIFRFEKNRVKFG